MLVDEGYKMVWTHKNAFDMEDREDELLLVLKEKGLKELDYTEKEKEIILSRNQRKYYFMIMKKYKLSKKEASRVILKAMESCKELNSIRPPGFY